MENNIIKYKHIPQLYLEVILYNATFNNISVILWWSVLLVEEIRVPGENYRPVANHCHSLTNFIA